MMAAREPRVDAPRPVLDRSRIVSAAVDLLNEMGLAGLSTRRLADRLGVQSPTLYWHVRNKEHLLELVADAICQDAFDLDPADSWREQLNEGLHRFRAMLLRHRDAAALLRAARPGPKRLGHVEQTVAILTGAGFPAPVAVSVARLLAGHVLDSVAATAEPQGEAIARLVREDPARFPRLSGVSVALAKLDAEGQFELGCGLILDGLECQLERILAAAERQHRDRPDDASAG